MSFSKQCEPILFSKYTAKTHNAYIVVGNNVVFGTSESNAKLKTNQSWERASLEENIHEMYITMII